MSTNHSADNIGTKKSQVSKEALDKGGTVREGEELDTQAVARGYVAKVLMSRVNRQSLSFQGAHQTGHIACNMKAMVKTKI